MTKLLVVHASPRKVSNSRDLTESFVEEFKGKFADADIVTREVGLTPPDHIDDDLIAALRLNAEDLNDRQKAALSEAEAMIGELKDADYVVIGTPMHNFSISAAFRTWIDHIVLPGKTFTFTAEGPKGLAESKPVFVISSRGGDYGDGSPENPNPYDFQTPYIRHIMGFIGLTDVRVIAANGLDMGEDSKASGIAAAKARIVEEINSL